MVKGNFGQLKKNYGTLKGDHHTLAACLPSGLPYLSASKSSALLQLGMDAVLMPPLPFSDYDQEQTGNLFC
jgi:hypothetical protein